MYMYLQLHYEIPLGDQESESLTTVVGVVCAVLTILIFAVAVLIFVIKRVRGKVSYHMNNVHVRQSVLLRTYMYMYMYVHNYNGLFEFACSLAFSILLVLQPFPITCMYMYMYV